MRRLSIIDLSTGHQPIHNEDRTIWVVFNGEIYNYRELRTELERAGHCFYTSSDTETIVHAYEAWGEEAFEQARGMSGLPFGIAPAARYTSHVTAPGSSRSTTRTRAGGCYFGSEIKSLLAAGVDRTLDLGALDHYLTFLYTPRDRSIFRGIRKLPPGHILRWQGGRATVRPYWQLPVEESFSGTEAEAADGLHDVLRDAVRSHLVSDVPLGAFLSGGIDSSLVVGLMSEVSDRPVKTFSIGFEEPQFDELEHARRVATHFRTDHHEFVVRPDGLSILDRLIEHFDEPFADSSAIPTWYVCEMARRHVTVVLSGDGGDELFGGYDRYLPHPRVAAFDRLPIPGGRSVAAALWPVLPHGTRGKNFLRHVARDDRGRFLDASAFFQPDEKAALYTPDVWRTVDTGAAERTLGAQFEGLSRLPFASQMMKFDFQTYLPEDVLVKVDRMSMAHSIESRVPLLDNRVIDFAARLPADMRSRRPAEGAAQQQGRRLAPAPAGDRPSPQAGLRGARRRVVQGHAARDVRRRARFATRARTRLLPAAFHRSRPSGAPLGCPRSHHASVATRRARAVAPGLRRCPGVRTITPGGAASNGPCALIPLPPRLRRTAFPILVRGHYGSVCSLTRSPSNSGCATWCEELQRSSFAQIVLVIENGDVDRPERGFARRLTRNRKRLAYVLYTRIDEYLFRQQPDAFTETSITDLVAGVPTIRVTPIKEALLDYFAAEDVAAIRERELDVAFRLGFRILRGDSLRIARHGVWSYHHGDNLVNRGGPAGFWEVMNQEPATGSVLQVLTDELDSGRAIYRSHAPTDPRSVYRNKDNFYRKSASFVGRKLKDLAERGAPALADDRPSDAFVPYTRPIYREPGNLEMVSHGVRLAGRYAADKLRDVWYLNQWSIAYRLHPGSDGPDPGLHRFKLLRPPADRFWADPFPVSADGLHYIFVEELPFSTNKGHISVLELDASGQLRGTAKVLEKDHHLSYPFVFEWRGERFMIPETGANRSIEVYRAHAFPHQWQLEQILMDDIYAVDATLLELDGAWWMFANVAADGVVNTDELHIFKAPTPFGPWSAHRRNPVKSDGRCARPAGRLQWNGRLYRPSQDCSGRYGAAIVINEVEKLNDCDYRETAVSRIEPRWAPNLLATHTLNSAAGVTVADVLVKRRRWASG